MSEKPEERVRVGIGRQELAQGYGLAQYTANNTTGGQSEYLIASSIQIVQRQSLVAVCN